jgi:hypothetical protein
MFDLKNGINRSGVLCNKKFILKFQNFKIFR